MIVWSVFIAISLSPLLASALSFIAPRICSKQGNYYCAYSRQCIAKAYRCDGFVSCIYGDDESGCPGSSSQPPVTGSSLQETCRRLNYYHCGYSQQCVANGHRCDGYVYCTYGDDESGCPGTSYLPPVVGSSLEQTCSRLDYYYCSYSGQCVAKRNRCDGYVYCTYGDDESGCPGTSSDPPVIGSSLEQTCSRLDYYYCSYSRQCVAKRNRCDGYVYCTYGDDESGCPGTSSDPPVTGSSLQDTCSRLNYYYCEYSRQCVATSHRCDGYAYCTYGDDESGCSVGHK